MGRGSARRLRELDNSAIVNASDIAPVPLPVPVETSSFVEHPFVIAATGLWGLAALAAFALDHPRVGYAIALTGGTVGVGLAVAHAVDKRRRASV